MGDFLEALSKVMKYLLFFVIIVLLFMFRSCDPGVETINNCENLNQTLVEENHEMFEELERSWKEWEEFED